MDSLLSFMQRTHAASGKRMPIIARFQLYALLPHDLSVDGGFGVVVFLQVPENTSVFVSVQPLDFLDFARLVHELDCHFIVSV